jgi:cold shock CspA family protein
VQIIQGIKMRKTGIVCHWIGHIPGRGYGFIFSEGRQWFFHASQYSEFKTPDIGDVVTFETAPGKKAGQPDMAVRVRPEHTNVLDNFGAAILAGSEEN